MTETSTHLSALDGDDPLEALQAVAALRRRLETEEAVHVRRARVLGLPWTRIADALGFTRQGVHKKYATGRRDLPDR